MQFAVAWLQLQEYTRQSVQSVSSVAAVFGLRVRENSAEPGKG